MTCITKRVVQMRSRTALLLATVCWLLGCMGLLVSVLFLMSEPVIADNNQREELVETVIAGMAQNYSRLKTVHLTLQVTTKHPKVSKEERKTYPDGDGLVTIITTPETSEVRKCVLRDKDIRVESVGQHSQERMVSYYQNLWTKYVPASRVARISLLENVGETLPPEDPRNIGMLGNTRSLREALRQDAIRNVQQIESGDGTMVIRIDLEDSKGRRWFVDCSPSFGFLPTAITYVRPNGNIAATTEFTYQEPTEDAWFLREAVQRLFDADTGDCLTVMTATIENLVVNQSVDEEVFKIAIPDGVRVYDDSNPEVFKRGREQAGDSSLYSAGWRGSLILISSLGVLGIFFVYFRYHRNNRRTLG